MIIFVSARAILLGFIPLSSNIQAQSESVCTTRRIIVTFVTSQLVHSSNVSSRNLKMFRNNKSKRKSTNESDDQLGRWVFGMAQIFGFWPFASKIPSNSPLRITACDCLRLTIVFGVCSEFLWYLLCWQPMKLFYTSPIEIIINTSTMSIYALSIIMNNIIIIHNRQQVCKILSTNQEFERKVSVFFIARRAFSTIKYA